MHEIILFFSDIFMPNNNNGMKIGLSQFKTKTSTPKTNPLPKSKKETKLSDLMRGL